MQEVKLFRTWASPFGLRIVWALKLKGIEYETIYEDLANKSSLLLEYNPVHKTIPVLLHNGTRICESLVILEYIDETWNTTNRFLPEDPLARATSRFWAKFNDEQHFAFEVPGLVVSLTLEYNPVHKTIPVLLHNGTRICESLVILEYIDETWNTTNRFLPEDPLARATSRFWAKFNDEQVFPSFFRYYVSQGKDQEEAKEKVLESLKLVEGYLKGKKFFNGETCGFLDIVFGWMAHFPGVMKKATNLSLLDEETFPYLSTWMKQFHDIPVIKENWPDEEVLILKFQEMREARGISISTEK